jgi:membrane protease YdiL (CAAX protease family)
MLLLGLTPPSLLLAMLLGQAVRLLTRGVGGLALQALITQFALYGFLFLAMYAIFRLKYERPLWSSLGFTRSPEGFVRPLLIGPLVAVGVVLGSLALRMPEIHTPLEDLLKDPVSIALVCLFAVTLGPLCEEAIFRGFLQPLFQRSLGHLPAIALACLPFALLHGPEYGWSWRHIVLLFFASGVFGWYRYRTGSTTPPALMHASYNLVFVIAYLIRGKEL